MSMKQTEKYFAGLKLSEERVEDIVNKSSNRNDGKYICFFIFCSTSRRKYECSVCPIMVFCLIFAVWN